MSSHVDHALVAPGATGVDPNHFAAAHLQILDAEAGKVDALRDRKKIAICGFASSSRHLMPFDDATWIIGAMNQFYRHCPRADYWFDIHHNWREGNVEGTDHPRALKQLGFPVFMVERASDVPNSVRYPIERLIQKFGIDYFTSTVSYMIAWAIDEIDQAVEARLSTMPAQVSLDGNGRIAQTAQDVAALIKSLYGEYTIGVFGIDLIVGDEYDFQKACAEFWLGVANARGIDVQIADTSALLKQRWRYGYQQEEDGGVLARGDLLKRQAELAARIKAKQDEHAKIVAELQTYDGAYQEVSHHLQVWELRSRGGVIPLSSAG